MGFADLVGQIRFVRIFHECLVVDEEHKGRHGDDGIFFVQRRGCVVEFHPLRLVIGRWRVFQHRCLQHAVEFASAWDFLSAFFDGDGLFQHLAGRVAGFCRASDEGCVGKEEEFASNMFFGFGDAVLVVGTGMVEIEFVQNDEAGFFLFKDELGDLAVLCGNAFREVDDQHAKIGAADGFFGTDGRENLDRVVAFAARAESSGIDEGEIFSRVRIGEIDRIAGGAGDFGNDGAFVLEDGVDQGGFAGVGFTDDCEFDPDLFCDFHAFFGLDVEGFDDRIDFIDEFGEVAAVFCGYKHAIGEAKR